MTETLHPKQIPISSRYLDDEETEEDVAMKAKLAAFMGDAGLDVDDDDSEPGEDEKPDVDVPDFLPMNSLDHVLLATNNWKEGMELFEEMTGLKPTKIGALRGAGSKSARVRLDKNTFVEIIGPDDKNPSEGMGPTLSAMPKGKLVPFHYAIRQEKEKVVIPESENWDRDEVVMVHADPDAFDESGEVAKWDFLLLYKHGIGGAVPAFVNWRENKFHPTCRLPKTSGRISYVQVQAPSGHYVHELLDRAEGITLHYGEPELVVSLDTPRGEITFSASNPKGVVMPGFGDENHPSLRKNL
ncbi:glyoxalase-like protein [Nitzschia inconspicua]|uniref:Glyoxalase-like protein n=2 Tax=Nitzschia inconspicua TaxID=303405 RepID=A0A9K3LDH8_9STRA|nr:glyoxalase-like protein [Nitzschia inconspicua]KAG7360364.1 glyoxalase-like protein [Nitzschia inconspicua]